MARFNFNNNEKWSAREYEIPSCSNGGHYYILISIYNSQKDNNTSNL